MKFLEYVEVGLGTIFVFGLKSKIEGKAIPGWLVFGGLFGVIFLW